MHNEGATFVSTREVLSFQAPVAKHAETWISQEDEAGSDDNDERIISEYRSSIEFAKVLDEGQFYPRLGDVHVFKASHFSHFCEQILLYGTFVTVNYHHHHHHHHHHGS